MKALSHSIFRLFSPLFFCEIVDASIVEFDRPPSWSGESIKCPRVGVLGFNSFTLSHVHDVSCSTNGNTVDWLRDNITEFIRV